MKKLLCILLSICILIPSVQLFVSAEDYDLPYESGNYSNYLTDDTYGKIITSSLYEKDGTLYRAEILTQRIENTDPYKDGKYVITDIPVLRVEEYDSSYKFVKGITVPGELSEIAGFYIGETANYLVCIQNNLSEDDNCEVFRVIKYSSDWKTRLGSAGVYGANTTEPTAAGSLRFTESGNYLYIHTCHKMYTSADGLNHQANMTFVLDTVNMEITYNRNTVSNINYGYVSHSFNQFIAVDETTDSIITADHGDAYPRSVVLCRYKGYAGNSTLGKPANIDVFDITGSIGQNYTGVTMGDLTVTENNYIVAFNSIDQKGAGYIRNVYLAIVPKNSFSESSVSLIKLTDYTYGSGAGAPYVTDTGDGKYFVMWADTRDYGLVDCVVIDENGNMLTDIMTMTDTYLSDCHPIVFNNEILWYSDVYKEPDFYSVNLSDYSDYGNKACLHFYEETVLQYSDCTHRGITRNTCTLCGFYYDEETAMNSHEDYDYDTLCDDCSEVIELNSSEIFTWDKDSYTTRDETATLTVNVPEGKSIYRTTAYGGIFYEETGNTFLFNLFYYKEPSDIIVWFRDGTYAKTQLTVEIINEDVEVTTEWNEDNFTTDNDYAILYLYYPKYLSIESVESESGLEYYVYENSVSFWFDSPLADEKITITLSNGQVVTETLVVKSTEDVPDEPDIPDTKAILTWDKESYNIDSDASAVLTVTPPAGAYISSITVTNCYRYRQTGNTITFDLSAYEQPNDIVITFSDGSTAETELYVIKNTEPVDVEIIWQGYEEDNSCAYLYLDMPWSVSIRSIECDNPAITITAIDRNASFWFNGVTTSSQVTITLTNGQILTTALIPPEKEPEIPDEPTTNEPTTSEPTTSEPTTKEPTTNEPTTSEPTTKEPITNPKPVQKAPKGDIDGNGKITAADARKILRISAKLESVGSALREVADYNSDGRLTASDARSVLRVSAKLEPWIK